MISLPRDVTNWLRDVFRACNHRITAKLSANPNIPEGSLDLTWIEHLTRYSAPITFDSGWLARLETHYLGGLRHIYSWEVADIGVLLFVRSEGQIKHSKVALLQSKRLYPKNMRVSEQGRVDYNVGFARLADPEVLKQSIAVEAEFQFTPECKYDAIIPDSDQVRAIDDYERQMALPIYYQLYNPWTLPFVQRIPLSQTDDPTPDLKLGVRVLPSGSVHSILDGNSRGFRPRLIDFAEAEGASDVFGWPLEEFIADEFLACKEGASFDSIADDRIRTLFYRRSGPIAAAIAITVEQAVTGT